MEKFKAKNIYILSPTAEVDPSQQKLINYLKTFKDEEGTPEFDTDI